MPTLAGPTKNLHTVYVYGQPLGVECSSCGHRALAFADKVDELRGKMRELHRLRFRCSACGSRAWKGWLFVDDEETAAWLEGRLIVSPTDGGRPTF